MNRSRPRTPADDLSRALARAVENAKTSGPLTRFARDPVKYALERLRVQLMPHQIAILAALARGIAGDAVDRVAVRSGQKCGKTKLAIIAALWFFECFEGARVFLAAAIIEQTKNVLWRELGQTLRTARSAGVDVDGKFAQSPMGGLVSADGSREIRGISGREIESIAGLSGRQLTIVDEASHLPTGKAETFAGNTMGGGSLLFISNPTKNEGPFFDAFTVHKEFWQTFHVDAEEVARTQAASGSRIPYVATLEKIREFKAMYGDDSPFWHVRVKGDWLLSETGRAISMAAIEAAVARWASADEDGTLAIGYDCAGPGNAGDEHAWAIVRGQKCVALFRRRGLNEESALAETYAFMRTYRRDGEIVRLVVDSEGPIGSSLYGRFRAESERRLLRDPNGRFEVAGVKSGHRAMRDRDKFNLVRDELLWNLAEWMRAGAIPSDNKLQAELYAPLWSTLSNGRLVCSEKSALRDILNRSPDSADALQLAVWQPRAWSDDAFSGAAADADDDGTFTPIAPLSPLSPYEGTLDAHDGAISPYGEERGDEDDYS